MKGSTKIKLGRIISFVFLILYFIFRISLTNEIINPYDAIPIVIVLVIFKLWLVDSVSGNLVYKGKKEEVQNIDELGIPLIDKKNNKPENCDPRENLRKSTDKKFILYLRPFAIDIDAQSAWKFDTSIERKYEREFYEYFKEIGPVVAFSNSHIDYLGGTKIESESRDWKEIFSTQINNAHLVIWHWGVTDSLIWELSELLQKVPGKLIIVFPVGGTDFERLLYWNITLWKLDDLYKLGHKLPESPKQARFILFSDDGTSIFFEPRITWKKKIFSLGFYDEYNICLEQLLIHFKCSTNQFVLLRIRHRLVFLLMFPCYIFLIWLIMEDGFYELLWLPAIVVVAIFFLSKLQRYYSNNVWRFNKQYFKTIEEEVEKSFVR